MPFRAALSLLAVLLLAGPAAAQFTTSDLAGTWSIHALRVPHGPGGDRPSWITGFVTFDAGGMVVGEGEVSDVGDFYEARITLTPGGLTVGPNGEITGTLGDASITGQFLEGQGGAARNVVVGAAAGSEQEGVYFILVRFAPTGFAQSDATGTWRVSSLQVPGPGATVSESVFGQIVIGSAGQIASGSLTSSSGSTSTFIQGDLTVLGTSGLFSGTLVTSPLGNEHGAFSGTFTPGKGLMVGVLTRVVETELRLGMFVLQREPTVQYVTADLAGDWNLFSVQSKESFPGDTGLRLTGRLTSDASGNVTGTVQTSLGSQLAVPEGFLLLDPNGLVSGSLFTALGTLTVQATMRPDKNQIHGVDRLDSEAGTHLGLFALVKATPAAPASVVQFRTGGVTVTEGSPATFFVDRSGATTTAVSVTFTATPLDAVPGQDYAPPITGVLSFPAGATVRRISVPTLPNTRLDGTRTVRLTLGGPTGGAALGRNTSLLTILDNDQPGVIKLGAATYSVAEKAGSLLVKILRSGTNLAGNVSVDYATQDGTALANVSYLPRSGSVTFNAGETKKTVSVPLVNDQVARGRLSFGFVLGRPTGGASLGTPSSAVVNVTDDDLGGTVKLSASSYRTVEGNGNFSVMLVRGGGSAAGAAVDYTITHRTTGGGDLAATSGTVVFAGGQMSAAISIPIFQDSTPELDETFTVTLSNPRGGAALGSPASALVTVLDDEMVIQFNRTGDRVKFQGNRPEVIRTGPLTTGVTVQYRTTSGTAILGQDFVLAETGTLVFPPGVAIALVPLTILGDNIAEGPETFTVTLLDPSAPAQLGAHASETFSIFDDDFGGRVRFDTALVSGAEGQTVTLTVRREGGTGIVLPVAWSVVGGNASAGSDFTPESGVVTFAARESVKTLTLALAADALVEGLESTFIALVVHPLAGALGSPSVAEVRIQDTTVAPSTVFQFQSPTAAVPEGSRGSAVITRTGDLSGSASIEYFTTPGTAGLGSDYDLVAGSITFGPGSASATVEFDALADETTEGPETFSLTLRNPSGIATIGSPSTVVVTITEPAPGYAFSLVAEAVSPIAFFRGFPSINNHAAVAFRAQLVDGNQSIYTTVPGTPTPVASTADGLFDSFSGGTPLADDGQVAFRAFLVGGGTAVYRNAGDGGALAPVAVPDASYTGFGVPAVSPGGRISFRASLAGGEQEAVLGGTLGGGLFTSADTADGRFAGFGQLTATGDRDGASIAFVASERSGASGIYLSSVDGETGAVSQIVDGSGFDAFGRFLSINDQGAVAFVGFPAGGGAGIFTGASGSAVTPIATTGDTYSAFTLEGDDGTPSINRGGTVVFYAALASEGGAGIFTGPDPVADKVIRTGDPLLGSTVGDLVLGGINDRGQIVFRADLADDRQVIVIATPRAGVPPRALTVTLEDPLVGVTRTIAGVVSLDSPAPPGGVDVVLAAAPAGLVTLSPTTVTIPGGATSGTFTVTGVVTGTVTITAGATGFQNGTTQVTVTASVISLGVLPTLGLGQSVSLPISLSTPAPAGGVTVRLASTDTRVAAVTPSVFIPGGAQVPAASPQVTGVDIGSAQINASAAGFAPESRGASVSVDVTFSPTPFGVVVGASGTITVTISAPAPPGGLTVHLVTGNSSVATVVPSVTIPAGQLSVPAAITGVVIGSTTLRAQGSGVTSARATINVTPPPPVNLGSSNHQLVGRDLQDEVVVSLGATPPGPVTVTITVTSTAIATVSTSAATAGGGTVVFDNVTTASVGTIFMQGRALGSTTVIARAAGYADDVVTVTVQPSGFVTFTGSFTTTTGAANPSIQINAARLDPATLNFAGTQAVRGGLTVSVPVTAVDQAGGPGVGTITTSPVVFTGTNVGFTEFDPAVVGTSVITVGVPPGFDTPNNFRQTTVTVGP